MFGDLNTWGLIIAGGPLMIPILLCSLAALAIIIEKFIYLSKIDHDPRKIKTLVFDHIKNNKIREAIVFCDENASPVAKVLGAGLLHFGSPKEEIKDALLNASQVEIPKLEHRLTALNTMAQISPLLGLLGTITGMASSFYTLQVRTASMSPVTAADLSGGIWEALMTTAAGLVVAIPSYIFYNYFVSRINNIIRDMEQSAAELLNHLSQI